MKGLFVVELDRLGVARVDLGLGHSSGGGTVIVDPGTRDVRVTRVGGTVRPFPKDRTTRYASTMIHREEGVE